MEKFELENEKTIELFGSFVNRTKGVFSSLIGDIKNNIKEYERKIKDTTKEVVDNEDSRDKCEQEIEKMESSINEIKDAIDNVESTYQKIVDAYSSTSKGDTKELYSEIIESARINCERDVDKNRTEIAHLNSDIESIKVSIAEFTKIIDSLNDDLEVYNLELYKYNKVLEYMEKNSGKIYTDLEEIAAKQDYIRKFDAKTNKKPETKRVNKAKEEAPVEDKKPAILETLKEEARNFEQEKSKRTVETPSVKETKKKTNEPSFFDYDFIDSKKEEPVIDDKKVYTDNLESLFNNNASVSNYEPLQDTKTVIEEPKNETPFLEEDYLDWENILNSTTEKDEPALETSTTKNDSIELKNSVNELLNPYGTTFERLKELTCGEITFKDGSKIHFNISEVDITKAVNAIDGNDLREMKIVGPEITLLRKLKMIKEGNL